ncbi:hypothetical protein ATANTOWER_019700 [Ataeniobius toweri]|uniref:Uncharacterized protein n=1 Tax=Ataeniobius toweri TaxID=208326 RepID=A0ABU7AYR2_9TELE|nr:hypothetical protein [Ataeniobius toweri]
MRTHKNTHTHTPNVRTHNNGRRTLTHTHHTYSILSAPGADTPEGQVTRGPRRWSPFSPQRPLSPKTGHPANPTPKPQRCPKHSGHSQSCTAYPVAPSRHQAGRPTSPSPKQSHKSINAAECPAKAPPARAQRPTQPTDRARKPGTEIQKNLSNPERAKTSVSAPIDAQDLD